MRTSITRTLSAATAVWLGLAAAGRAQTSSTAEGARWQPARTRAFIVSLTRFAGGKAPSFATAGRLDDRFVEVLLSRGVPRRRIVYLKDERATTRAIRSEFTRLLRRSQPGELVLFYFGSHGGYNPEKGTCWFVSFDGSLPFDWVFDSIERDFKGSHALLAADCCHSGGLADLAHRGKSRIAYACLSSTYKNQTAWSGWRFLQCLIRGLDGDPVVDRGGRGFIDLQDLAGYTRHYMAFAAEGKPCFTTTAGFDPGMRLAPVRGTKKDPQVGKLVEVRSRKAWAPAEIVDVRGDRFKVHYTADTRTDKDEWVPKDQVWPRAFERFPAGTRLELQGGSDRKWYPGVVVKTWESLHYCRYDGYGPAYNEWFGPSRIRPSFDGSWVGRWANDVGQAGKDTLVLRSGDSDLLTGTWSGNIPLSAERVGKHVFVFEARTPKRSYRGAGRIAGRRLFLDYVAEGGREKYAGWVVLQRAGAVDAVRRDPRAEFGGKWGGTYENSKGGVGDEALELVEAGGRLRGTWSGLAVTGERLGSATFYLTAKRGDLRYRVVGRVDRGGLTLSYSAATRTTRYTGRARLKR